MLPIPGRDGAESDYPFTGPLPTGGALLVPAAVAVVGTLVLVAALLGSTPP